MTWIGALIKVRIKLLKKGKVQGGITLVALVITIVILIILSVVSINAVMGEGGIIQQAKHAAEMTANSTTAEQEEMNRLEAEFANIMAEKPDSPEPQPEPEPELPESTSYVGYYADVDGNGSVDGVIYADLAKGGSGTWNPSGNSSYNSNGTYTIPKGSNFKKYRISKNSHADDFGTKDVLTVANTSGNERFYVMALDDVDSSTHCWYYSANGNMSDYQTATSISFGKGKQNTKNMITKWNNSSYGAQNDNGTYSDMWGISEVQSKINASPAWYVPSREEWATFGGQLGITNGNYSSKGLSNYYWSSSQGSTSGAWRADFIGGCMFNGFVDYYRCVRLGTTF